MKRFFSCCLLLILMAFTALTLVGCMGFDTEDFDKLFERYQNGEITLEEFEDKMKEQMVLPLHGVKVLYRPDEYDWEKNPGEDNQGHSNARYYGRLAHDVLRGMSIVYGNEQTIIADYLIDERIQDMIPSDEITGNNLVSQRDLYYDSIRYQITNIDHAYITYDESVGEESPVGEFYKITANTGNAWNWTFNNVAILQDANYNSYLFAEDESILDDIYFNGLERQGNIVINKFINQNYDGYYETLLRYPLIFTGSQYDYQPENYSDLVKAIEYALYCYALDVEPERIYPEIDENGLPKLRIDGNFASIDEALQYEKKLFVKIGNFVGMTEGQKFKLKNWIYENVIGDAPSVTTVSQRVTEIVVSKNAQGEYVAEERVRQTLPSITVDRMYEQSISDIVDAACQVVVIGTEDEETNPDQPTIEDPYLASEIVDYYGNVGFFLTGDKDDPFTKSEALEYQSTTLMFSEKFSFANLWLSFKYDAGLDGDEIVAQDASLKIRVHVNHYRKSDNSLQTVMCDGQDTFDLVIPDGPFEYGMETHNIFLFGMQEKAANGNIIQSVDIETPFNLEIGNGILKTMDFKPSSGKWKGTPKQISGNDRLRKYYKLNDPSDENGYYYGTLNSAMFGGSDGCDYFEIAYEVIKTPGSENYSSKFYTGISLVAE